MCYRELLFMFLLLWKYNWLWWINPDRTFPRRLYNVQQNLSSLKTSYKLVSHLFYIIKRLYWVILSPLNKQWNRSILTNAKWLFCWLLTARPQSTMGDHLVNTKSKPAVFSAHGHTGNVCRGRAWVSWSKSERGSHQHYAGMSARMSAWEFGIGCRTGWYQYVNLFHHPVFFRYPSH